MSTVAVIGAGYWGKNLVRTFHELNALEAVAEVSLEIRGELATKYSDVRIHEEYVSVLETDVSAVAIATPANTHFKVAKEALLAGKDVFVEKPMTLSSIEAEELVELAKSHQRILMVGHLLLFQPPIQKMKNLIRAGAIGTLHSLHQERLKLGIVRSVENVLWSFGVHDIAALLYLVGQIPDHVQITGQRIIQENIEDDVYLHLKFPTKVQAHLHSSWLWPGNRRRLTAVGSTGMLVYDENNMTVALYNQGIDNHLSVRDDGQEIVCQGYEKPLTLECSHFLECVQSRKQPISNGATGVAVIRVLEEASNLLKRGYEL